MKFFEVKRNIDTYTFNEVPKVLEEKPFDVEAYIKAENQEDFEGIIKGYIKSTVRYLSNIKEETYDFANGTATILVGQVSTSFITRETKEALKGKIYGNY